MKTINADVTLIRCSSVFSAQSQATRLKLITFIRLPILFVLLIVIATFLIQLPDLFYASPRGKLFWRAFPGTPELPHPNIHIAPALSHHFNQYTTIWKKRIFLSLA